MGVCAESGNFCKRARKGKWRLRFFHTADVHLGMEPDLGCDWSERRKREIWESFERLIETARKEKPELLLIAGDLFHRQPLRKELKAVNDLFASIPDTQVVLMAGNHDYLKDGSYYLSASWAENVTGLFGQSCERADFPRFSLSVYGCSYYSREVTENLYREARPSGAMKYHILLAHGGDEKHSPWKKEEMAALGFDYVACGHIHRPEILVPGRMAYAGALEPATMTQSGEHGYIDGVIDGRGTRLTFVPFAVCEYRELELTADEGTTQYSLEQDLEAEIRRSGEQNIYRVKIAGFRDEDLEFSLERLKKAGNVVEVTDATRPAYRMEQLKREYEGSLIGAYLEAFEGAEGTVEKKALDYGLEALLGARQE